MGRIRTHFPLHRLPLLVALAVVSGLVLGGGTRAGSANAASGSTSPSTGTLRICSGCADHGLGSPGRYSYVVLNSWQAGLIPQLKQANPNVKVLVYKDVAATLSYDCNGGVDNDRLPAGVGYCWANANHPDWFLTDTTGVRIEFCDFHGAWQMDVGNPAYQQQWLANVLADLRSGPWDGVVLDDVNQSETWHLCGRTMARYPGSTYSAATESFLAAVGPALRGAGYLAMPNIALDDWWTAEGTARWDRWVSYSSGAVQEYYSKWGRDSGQWFTDDGTHNDWSLRQALFTRTEAAGKPFIGVTYAPSADVRSMRYARASFLLDWNGGPSALVFEPTDPEAQDPYAADWSTDLGSPKGARRRVGVAWERPYSNGIVVLDPSPSVSQTVSLGGRYVLPNGQVVSSVTVGPTEAVLLRSRSNPPADPLPANTSRPRVSAARAGRALGAKTGSWKNAATFSFQWLRCNDRGKRCRAVAGASSRRYVLGAADVGRRLRIVVTAVNSAGSSARASAPTKKISRLRLLRRVRHSASLRSRLPGRH